MTPTHLTMDRVEAVRLGLISYFTGRPCVRGHLARRYTKNGDCFECLVSKRSNYRARYSAKRTLQTNAWRKNNPDRARILWADLRARGRARLVKATPAWVRTADIRKIYKERPAGYHVDHILPISSPTVCGLHVPWNLQYLPAKENRKKSNKVVA